MGTNHLTDLNTPLSLLSDILASKLTGQNGVAIAERDRVVDCTDVSNDKVLVGLDPACEIV